MEPSTDLVREHELKTKMAILCNQALKAYAKEKRTKNVNNPRMVALINAFLKAKVMTFKYSVLLTVIFGREFEDIKRRVISGNYSLNHISTESYWERGASHIRTVDAIFFSYTFYCEIFPEGASIMSKLDEKLLKNNTLDVLNFLEQKIAEEEKS
ncbi:hypothetical protein OTK49_00545 [Vibrio coralliirubri]|uniref:hypothetical protein n=1 Tax=Vibrio coralliirubri TaxID=1516159 RepID=UPI0022849EB2|nr:hypothetical protein [Vibrio coralliirubri]MCY9861030.1 hypothetical protein [Vibrio coralliirubri]